MTPRHYDSICCFRSREADRKLRVCWEVTTHCNLNCAFCHRSLPSTSGPDLSTIRGASAYLRRLGGVIVSGGEPLLRDDIIDILTTIRDHDMSVDMCTNGTLITADIARDLSRVLEEVSVSLDAHEPELHDAMRGVDGAWERTVRGIEILLESGLEVHTISLVTLQTLRQLRPLAEFLENIGVTSSAFIGEIPIGSGENALTHDGAQRTIRRELELVRSQRKHMSVNSKELLVGADAATCKAGEAILGLDVELNLKPCILMSGAGIPLADAEAMEGSVFEALAKMSVGNAAGGGEGFCPGSRVLNRAGG